MHSVVVSMAIKRTKRNYMHANRTFGNTCVYCGGYGDTVDHVVPWAYIQDQSASNLVKACRSCNSIAGSLVFQTFDDKRDYVRKRRIELGYGITGTTEVEDETDICDEGGELLVQDAIWDDVHDIEPNYAELDKVRLEDYLPRKSDIILECGKPTKNGTPCKLSVLYCTFHSGRSVIERHDMPWQPSELIQSLF